MTSFVPQGANELGANKIARSPTAYAFYNNPIAIATRGPGVPVFVKPSGKVYLLTGTSGTFNIPPEWQAFHLTIQGGSHGLGTGATLGTASTVTYDGVTYSGNPGATVGANTLAAGGTAVNGDLNIPGGASLGAGGGNPYTKPGSSWLGVGVGSLNGGASGCGFGWGTATTAAAAGAAGCCLKYIERVPGVDTFTYSVGTAGAGSLPGGPGIIIIDY